MPAPDPRAAVRVGALDRTLEAFNEELGHKVAMCLAKYDAEMVQPRIDELQARAQHERARTYVAMCAVAFAVSGLSFALAGLALRQVVLAYVSGADSGCAWLLMLWLLAERRPLWRRAWKWLRTAHPEPFT